MLVEADGAQPNRGLERSQGGRLTIAVGRERSTVSLKTIRRSRNRSIAAVCLPSKLAGNLMRLFQGRFVALAITALTFAKAWPHMQLLWAIAFVDGVALFLIWRPDKIDEWTFGAYLRGGAVDSHTPAWMIAGFGWILLLLISVLLFWPGLLSHAPG
jgi:hypothetical protein